MLALMAGEAEAIAVSILVVLDWTMMRGMPVRRYRRLAVSILVVLDWTMMHALAATDMAGAQVSILVVLDWTMMPRAGSGPRAAAQVSILVVLDWTMMRAAPGVSPPPRSSFNPCCIGLDNDASVAPPGLGPRHGFNPCCIGLDNDARTLDSCGVFFWEFQSLLYWIGQ